MLKGVDLVVVEIGKDGVTESDILVHDAAMADPSIHLKLANMEYPEFPVAMGVIRAVPGLTYETTMEEQISEVQAKTKVKSFRDLAFSGDVWEVK
jgi:2-oxoglutarate/2-oxoacid ferredoxin oxidoreductase subunit beta